MSAAEKLRDVRGLIHALESEARHRRVLLDPDGDRWDHEYKRDMAALKLAQERVDRLLAMKDNAENWYSANFERIAQLRQEEKLLIHRALVEKLVELYGDVNDLKSELSPETVQNAMEAASS